MLWVVLALVLSVCAVPRPGAAQGTAAGCVQNLPKRTSVQTVELRAKDRTGAERSLRAKIYWKRFDDGNPRVLARFSEPTDIDGAGLLMIGTGGRADLFLYMPEVKKVRRITSQMMKGTLFGTDFSYEDLERLQGMQGKAAVERLPDADLDGTPVQVSAARPPADAASSYERVVSYVDAKTCVPLKLELYETGDRLRKVLVAERSEIKQHDGLWVPHRVVMRDLRDETETALIVHEIELEPDIADRTFSQTTLERGREK